MTIEITMPEISSAIDEVVIARWLKKDGDRVERGDMIAEVETDKATVEVESGFEGIFKQALVGEGEKASVNQVIALLAAVSEDGETLTAAFDPPQDVSPQAEPVRKASPVARRMAEQNGLELEGIAGSGPGGKIVRRDVEEANAGRAAAETATGFTDEPVNNMRRTIAARLTEAKATIPHFYIDADCRIDALLALRADINAARLPEQKISINDFIIKAAACAMAQVPEMNRIWQGETIRRFHAVDISVAVSTETGLFTPVVRDVGSKSLSAVSDEMKTLAERARAGRLRPDEYTGGAFSISNLGMFGASAFSAIINPPQAGILAIGAGERRPAVVDDALVAATMMGCRLSVDHRVVDGAVAARWLAAFKAAIEAPFGILV